MELLDLGLQRLVADLQAAEFETPNATAVIVDTIRVKASTCPSIIE